MKLNHFPISKEENITFFDVENLRLSKSAAAMKSSQPHLRQLSLLRPSSTLASKTSIFTEICKNGSTAYSGDARGNTVTIFI